MSTTLRKATMSWTFDLPKEKTDDFQKSFTLTYDGENLAILTKGFIPFKEIDKARAEVAKQIKGEVKEDGL